MNYTRILITGGAGFVGSNLAVSFKKKYPGLDVIVMDNLKRRGSELNITRLKEYGIKFFHGDIRNREDFPSLEYNVLIECSAEPSVLAGYDGSPLYVINTNLMGTINCLEDARKHRAHVIFLSTSRVYPYDKINSISYREEENRFAWEDNQDITGWSLNGIGEKFSLEGPKSIYGASKLCSELVLQEYISMYGMKGIINRCGVIAGPWQFGKVDQGVFTLWMASHYFKKDGLKYIGFGGTGKQVRDLIHVNDIFELLDIELNDIDKFNGTIYNVGGSCNINLSLKETTKLCEHITGNRINISGDCKTRPADLAIYMGDSSKICSEADWKPEYSAEKILEDIFLWIKENEKTVAPIFC